MSSRVTVYLNKEERAKLDGLCKDNNCSKSSVLKDSLNSFDGNNIQNPVESEVVVVIEDIDESESEGNVIEDIDD